MSAPWSNMSGSLAQSRHSPMMAASKTNSGLPINQPHTYQQSNEVQHNGTYNQFNPAQPPFQPTGIVVEPYQTPRTLNVPQHNTELVDLVNNHNIQKMTETARLDHSHRGLAREFDDLRNNVDSQIEAMKKHVMGLTSSHAADAAQKQLEPSKTTEPSTKAEADYYDYYVTGGECYPSDQMLNDHPIEDIASSYLDEAEKREASATALRKQAFELCPDTLRGGRLQICAAPIGTPKVAAAVFACCATEFSTIGELVEHVEQTHTVPEYRPLDQARSEAVETRSAPNEENGSSKSGQAPPLASTKQEDKPTLKIAETSTSPWTPAALRNIPPVVNIPDNKQTFSFEFIRTTFGGDYWSPGFYFIPEHSMLPSKAYWILDVAHEPFLPNKPGAHGAKLTAFFNETVSGAGEAPGVENYLNVPVFIKTSGNDEYSYFGNYSQLRFSDKVGYDAIAAVVPDSVLRNHAEQLAETGRPAWVTQALREQFWPKPKYEGPMPTDSALHSPTSSIQNGNSITTGQERRVMKALVEYAAELKAWEKDSKLKVNLLTSDSIFNTFSVADTAEEPGLRLFWEYLQCVSWDTGFYKMLVGLMESTATKLEIGSACKKRRPSPDRKDGSTAAKMGLSSEATFKATKAKAKEVVEEYPGPEAKTNFVRHDFDDKPVGPGSAKKCRLGNDFGNKDESSVNGAPSSGSRGDLKAAKKFSASVQNRAGNPISPHMRGRK